VIFHSVSSLLPQSIIFMKILFQGDSITDAFRKPEEINPAFQLGNGYVFLVASKLGERHPEIAWEFVNRGVSGHRIEELVKRWTPDALDIEPDLLSLLVGVNNVNRHFFGNCPLVAEEALNHYRSLLLQSRARNANLKILIIEPFLLLAGSVTPEWQDILRPLQKGVAALAEEFDAAFVPAQSLFDACLERAPADFWIYDGIHPTHAGFQVLADAWLRTVAARGWIPQIA
jgi:lysophospholipase L1-like esterase